MNASYKGKGPVSAKYACGGPEITTRSRFLKVPDTFSTDEKQEEMMFTKTARGVSYAVGGPPITTRSRFLKVPDTFRTDIQKTDYGKKGKGGELSKTEGDTKSQKAIKPKT
jgi:hypothetical protein